MLFFLAASYGLWRAVVLVALALFPYAAPVDVVRTASPVVAGVRLVIALAGLVALSAFSWIARSRSARTTALGALVVTLSVGLGFALPPSEWPLSRVVWFGAPAVWALVASVATLVPGARTLGAQIATVIAVFVFGGVSLAASAPRLRSTRVLLSANPGIERAALDEAQRLDEAGRHDEASGTLFRCARANPDACACIAKQAHLAVDAHRYDDVLAATAGASERCTMANGLLGLRAEALANLGKSDDALRSADLAARLDDRNANAAYARAIVFYGRGNNVQAMRFARQAIGLGRGTEARVFLAGMLIRNDDLAAARSELEDTLAADPTSTAAMYDLALVQQKAGRYHDAREGYLKLLARDPSAIDARYNLVLLAHSVGADAEARHDVDEMAKIAPDDPRIALLRSVLDEGQNEKVRAHLDTSPEPVHETSQTQRTRALTSEPAASAHP